MLLSSTCSLNLSQNIFKLVDVKLTWRKCESIQHMLSKRICHGQAKRICDGQARRICHGQARRMCHRQVSSVERKHLNQQDSFAIQPDIAAAVDSTLLQYTSNESPTVKVVDDICSKLQRKDYVDIGQPTPFAHPHLFQSEDEATPGIKHEEYAKRRHSLMRVLSQTAYGKKFDKHVAILSASTLKTMTNDIPYPFHQDTDFLYLTGVNEPDAFLVLEYSKAADYTKFLLFVKPTNPKRVLWDGAVIGESAAVAYFKADEAFPLNKFASVVKQRYSTGKYCVWYRGDDGKHTRNDTAILDVINATHFLKAGEHPIEYNMQLLRLIKSDAEIRIMKKSASIASDAFTKVMFNGYAGVAESHLHALLDYQCKISGAQHLSFPPVVAGGENANTLHYINNTGVLGSGDLVLMDGGCEFNAYASDITRTWPVSGKFSPAQKELYQIVLDVQKHCLKACKPGVSLEYLYKIMLTDLGKRLQNIGLIGKNESESQLGQIATEFCPHHLGHYLGMDTHDTPLVHKSLPLQVGMAFTLEPGLYIPKTNNKVPTKYRGIGIRIEDDIVLTGAGPYVLTAQLPKETKDIEKLLAARKKT